MPTRHDGPIRHEGGPDPDDSVVHTIGPIEACPDCQGRDFLIEEVASTVAFCCLGCGAEWRYELGYVWRVHD